jgi:hypothetical protein
MRKLFILSAIFTALFLTACQKAVETTNTLPVNRQNTNSETTPTDKENYTVELTTEPKEIVSNSPTNIVLTIKNLRGEILEDLAIVHEKPMHLIIVSEDLSEFNHIHPIPQDDGTLQVKFAFPNGGKYRLYADFTPKDGTQIIKSFPAQVSGETVVQNKLTPDTKFEKTLEGIKVVMKPAAEFESNKELMLNFSIFDAKTNELVTDLENYLGEKAHFVIISQDLNDFVHAHPMSMDNMKMESPANSDSEHKHDEKMPDMPPNSQISAHVTFPNAGIYKVFAEVKRQGKVIAVPFVVEVKKGKTEKILENTKVSDGAFKIVVSKEGFTPSEINLSKDKFQKLAFLRVDVENCADEVVFKDLNITQKLPVGEVVLIDIPNDKTGEINFACGMNMFKGKVVIQ